MELAAVAGPSTGNKSLGDLLRCLFFTFCFCVFQVHLRSVAEPEPPRAATFRVELEPELIFLLAGAESQSYICLSQLRLHLFAKQKRKAFVVVTKHDLRAIYNGNSDPKKTCIHNSLFKSAK